MGLIREPRNVDFYILDSTWTEEEQNEFSAFIQSRKEQLKKRSIKRNSAIANKDVELKK